MDNYNNFLNEYYERLRSSYRGYDDYNRQNNMSNMPNMNRLYNPSEGYMRGNMFESLYEGYKNYKPENLTATTDKDKKLLEIDRLAFAAHDLNLFLDLHPDDESMLALFNDYRERVNNLISEYEKTYGPINISSNSLINSPFKWESESFPWERGGLGNV